MKFALASRSSTGWPSPPPPRLNILFNAAKLGFFLNTDDADVVIGVDRPLTPLIPLAAATPASAG